jgi:transcriptional/translational regulatory protein YebC/TACO1
MNPKTEALKRQVVDMMSSRIEAAAKEGEGRLREETLLIITATKKALKQSLDKKQLELVCKGVSGNVKNKTLQA